MKYRLIEKSTTVSAAYSQVVDVYDVGSVGGDSILSISAANVDTPSAVIVASAEIDFETDTWTSVAHLLTSGLKVRLTTSSALPSGLALTTDYFVIVVSADTFRLASSLALAIAGTPVALADAGVGNQTVTPTALAGGNIKFEQSNSSSGPWVALGSATNITADADVALEKDRPASRYVRVYLTLTAGNVSVVTTTLVKGDRDA